MALSGKLDKDGNVKTLSLAISKSEHQKYTFSRPTGLSFATQFARIALIVTEKAAFECVIKALFRMAVFSLVIHG